MSTWDDKPNDYNHAVELIARLRRELDEWRDRKPVTSDQLAKYELRATMAERERCAKIAERYVERTNADIAHAILNEIRQLEK